MTVISSYDQLLSSLKPSLWWKLSDVVGSTTVIDSSGNNLGGLVHGGVTFAQPGAIPGIPLDTSATFDGSSGYVATTSELTANLTNGYTAIAWVKGLSTLNEHWIVGWYDNVLGAFGLATNYLQLSAYLGGQALLASDNYFPTDGNWHLLAASYSGHSPTIINLFLDGNLIGSTTISGTAPTTTGYFGVGDLGNYSELYSSGGIAQVALFDYILTASQIESLYTLAPVMPTPAIYTVVPSEVPANGGVEVALTGVGFSTASSLIFGPIKAASFTVIDDQHINAIVPPYKSSTVNIVVTNEVGITPNNSGNVFAWYDPFLYTNPDKRSRILAPQLTRWRSRYRGQRESYKTNLQMQQFLFDTRKLYEVFDRTSISITNFEYNLEFGANISVNYWSDYYPSKIYSDSSTYNVDLYNGPTFASVPLADLIPFDIPGTGALIVRLNRLLDRIEYLESQRTDLGLPSYNDASYIYNSPLIDYTPQVG